MKNVLIWIAILATVCLLIWGGWWLAKTVSYKLWYEDMVKETITEMIKPEALK